MNREDIIARLRASEADLRARGVRHAGLFGSVARGTATAISDIDIILDLDIDSVGDVYDYVALKQYVSALFPGPVDVINRAGLKAHLGSAVEDEVHAF